MEQNLLKVDGPSGQVKWGFKVAAVLGSWRFTGDGRGGSISAKLVSHDRFCLTQAPLVIVAPCGTTQLRWPVTAVSVNGTTLTATVGPRQRKG